MSFPRLHRSVSRTLALPALVFLAGCASMAASSPVNDSQIPGGQIISAESILASRATNAFEALERARTHLLVQETQGTVGTEIRMIHRGIDSLVNDPQVMVVIDGTPAAEPIGRLRAIPAESIAYIQLLSGREATPRFGTLAGNGVIMVQTRAIS